MGRPTKCTDTLIQQIAAHVRISGSISLAAGLCGVDGSTACRWFRDGKHKSKYRQFHHAIKKALAEFEADNLAVISESSKKQWTAAAWLLERNPHTRKRYAPPTKRTDNRNQSLPEPKEQILHVRWTDGNDDMETQIIDRPS